MIDLIWQEGLTKDLEALWESPLNLELSLRSQVLKLGVQSKEILEELHLSRVQHLITMMIWDQEEVGGQMMEIKSRAIGEP